MAEHTPPIRLDDLIAAIRKVHDDPLDQLADAMLAAAHLDDVADSLIGHFVDRARRSGASWTAIGSRMGVSKQAAQKRFVDRVATTTGSTTAAGVGDGAEDGAETTDRAESENTGDLASADNPFSRFTPRAANVLMGANSDAAGDHAEFVTPAHIAQSLTLETQALAWAVLGDLGVDPGSWSIAVEPLIPAPREIPDAEISTVIPFDEAAKTMLETTISEAVDLGHDYVGTEHLLLGFFSDDSLAGVLTGLGLTRETVREGILSMMSLLPQADPEPH